jgi:hypothetical protein
MPELNQNRLISLGASSLIFFLNAKKLSEVALLEDYLDRIAETISKSLKFPDKTFAHGFEEELDERCITEITYEEDSSEDLTISAIDGGSNTIIKTPTFALVLNRVYCNKFDRMNKLDFVELSTFISSTRVIVEGDKVFFETETYPQQGACPLERTKINADDPDMRIGRMRGDLERAISMARRFCEWNFVSKALGSGAEFIVMDGSLQTAFTGESELANRVYEEAGSKGANVAGLSKSSMIYTMEGYPLVGFLNAMARRKGLSKWIAKIGRSEEWAPRAEVYFVKLHEGADRAFRLDIFEKAGEADVARLVNSLQVNSKYFAFPGYPYALIDAHTYARVGNDEAMHIRDLILDKLDLEDASRLEQAERALMGHDVLDELG